MAGTHFTEVEARNLRGKNTLKTEWTNFNEGKAAGKAVFELKRKM